MKNRWNVKVQDSIILLLHNLWLIFIRGLLYFPMDYILGCRGIAYVFTKLGFRKEAKLFWKGGFGLTTQYLWFCLWSSGNLIVNLIFIKKDDILYLEWFEEYAKKLLLAIKRWYVLVWKIQKAIVILVLQEVVQVSLTSFYYCYICKQKIKKRFISCFSFRKWFESFIS